VPDQKPRVLFVDEKELDLRAYRRAFSDSYDVLTAGTAAEALRLVSTGSVDVAVVAHLMPTDGLDLVAQMKGANASLPCLLVTPHQERKDVIDAFKSGHVTMIIKAPWTKDELGRWLAQLTRITSMRRAVGDLKDWHKRTTTPLPGLKR
jgi:response regulator RpfG family c-di-GMP phosphodiesterase